MPALNEEINAGVRKRLYGLPGRSCAHTYADFGNGTFSRLHHFILQSLQEIEILT